MSDNKVEVILGVRNAGLKQGLSQAKEWVADWRKEVAAPIAGALAAGGLISATENIMEYAKQVRNLSDAYGVSTTALQQWSGALGVDLEEVAGMFNDLTIAQAEALGGDDDKLEQFKKLGISVEQLASMNVADLMMAIGRGMMDASAMGAVMGEESVRLRVRLKELAEGSLELGAAMQEGTVRGLAAAADEMAHMKQETSAGFGELLLVLYKVNRSVWTIVTGLMTVGTVAARGVMIAQTDLLSGSFDKAKATLAEALKDAKIQAEAFRDELKATWVPEDTGAGRATSAFQPERGDSNAATQKLDREVSLMEKLEGIRREAALEAADDQEKLTQLVDREFELRLATAGLLPDSVEYLEAQVAAEEAALAVQKQQAVIADKARQTREKETQERKTAAEKLKREQEAAEKQLQEEQDRLAVMHAQGEYGDEAARKLEKHLEYQRKIAELEGKIAEARKDGNRELAETLNQSKKLLEQQAQQSGIDDEVADKLAGSDARRQKGRDQRRVRRARGSIESRRREAKLAQRANSINRPDVFDGPDPRGRDAGETQGPPVPPGFNFQKPDQPKDQQGEKLDAIKGELTAIKNKLDKPLTHG